VRLYATTCLPSCLKTKLQLVRPLWGPQTSFSSCKTSNLASTRNVLSDPSGMIMQDWRQNVTCRPALWHMDSSDGVATGCGLDGRVSIPGRGKCFLHSIHTCSGDHPASYQMGTGGRAQGREADHFGLALRSRIVELLSLLPHMSSWHRA
jgi:hypothetical protein